MTKKKKGLLIVSFSLLALIAALTIWQWNNIEAVIIYSKYSKKEIDEMLATEKNSEIVISKLPGNINDLTDDEKKRLNDGSLSKEEAVKRIIERSDGGSILGSPGSSAPSASTEKANTTDKPAVSNTGSDALPKTEPTQYPANNPTKDYDEKRIKELVAQLYVLKASYTDRLDKLVQQAKSEYISLPASEKNSAGKKKILLKYLGQATAMENSCDTSVDALLSEISTLLTRNGSDLSLVEEIKKVYRQEKSLKKASYISQFSKI